MTIFVVDLPRMNGYEGAMNCGMCGSSSRKQAPHDEPENSEFVGSTDPSSALRSACAPSYEKPYIKSIQYRNYSNQ